jgi:hypothetical protein
MLSSHANLNPADPVHAAYIAATPEDHARIDAVLRHAHERYDHDGWDIVVECWERPEILKHLRKAGDDVAGAIKTIGDHAKMVDGYRREVQAEADY